MSARQLETARLHFKPGRWTLGARPQTGFTLVELVTSLIIISILIGMAAPSLLDHRSFHERSYADELADATRYAQRIAVASGCTARIVIAAASYTAQQRNSCNAGAWNRVLQRVDGSQVTASAPANVVATPSQTITFDSLGNVTGPTPVAFTVGAFSLSLDPLSSVVTVSP